MKIINIKISDGPTIKDGDEIEIYYKVSTNEEDFNNGVYVEKTYNPDIPIIMTYTSKTMLEGVYKGLKGMASGGSIRKLIIEPQLAFGNKHWTIIPPGSTLFVEICLAQILSRNSISDE